MFRIRIIKKYIVAFFSMLLIQVLSGALFAQNADSLKKVVNQPTVSDSIRVYAYIDIADIYIGSNLDTTLFYIKKALALGNKIGFKNGIGETYLEYGFYYLRATMYDTAIKYFRLGEEIYNAIGNKKGLARAAKGIGHAYTSQEKYGLAIDFYTKSQHISESINDNNSTGEALSQIGSIYRELGNFPKSLSYYFQALNILEKMHNAKAISSAYTNISIIYTNLGDNNKALEYLNKSIAIDEQIGNKRGAIFSIVNMGILYAQTQDFNNALKCFQRGWAISDSLHDEYWANTCKSNVAEAYFYLGKYEEALTIYKEVLKRSKEIRELIAAGSAQSGIGKIYIMQGKITEGIKYLEASYDVIKASGMKQPILETALALSEAYEKANDPKNALKYHKIYYDLRDSVYNEKSSKQIQQIQFDYELQKKEAQIEILEKNKAIALGKSEKQRVVMWALIIGLISLLIFIVVLYRSRQKEKSSKEKIVKQKEEIQLQASKLEELNKFKDKTFSVLSHDLRGPITAFSSTMMMLDEHIISPEEFKLLQPEISKQLNSLNILLENLLNWGRTYMKGQIAANPQNTQLNTIVKQTTALLTDIAANKEISLKNEIDNDTTVFCDPAQLDIVLRNLISNAVKFTRRKGAITLSAEDAGNNTIIKISDTGIGMSNEQLSKLFTINTDNNTFGTDGEKGMGLGLLLCAEFIKTNNGDISVTSEAGVGSVFTITLPKKG